MKILVYGAGVLGGNLAGNLFRAKKDVTLLARGKWAETIRKNGLVVKNTFSPGTAVSRVPVITELKPEDFYDVIFVVVRYTQLDGVLDALRANGSKNIVLVGNNVRAREYAGLLPGKNVLFAFGMSAGQREADRIVGIDMKKITIGQLRDAPSNEDLIHVVFDGTGYKVVYEPNMEDYLLCHAAFVLPAALACYHADGDLRRLKRDRAYLNLLIDANIEGYRAIEKGGHAILPESDQSYESASYRRLCYAFYRLMCATPLGRICASDHAMNAVDEMSALNRDMKAYFEKVEAPYEAWKQVEKTAAKYLE